MNKKNRITLILLVTLITGTIMSCQTGNNSAFPAGPYFGQVQPGPEPELFMPGLVSTHGLDICITFLLEGNICVYSNDVNIIYTTYHKNGRWTKPERAVFPDEEGKTQYSAGPDGRTLYFQSSRPTHPGDDFLDLNTWTVQWSGSGWTEPIPLPKPANTEEYHEICPSVSPDGTLFYFSGWRKEEPLGDLYFCRFVDGHYQPAEKFGYPINSEYHELDQIVSPDGSFLIFSSNRPGGLGVSNLYICFADKNGGWSHPIILDDILSSHPDLNTAGFSPDGKFFFFSSSTPTDIPKGSKVESPLIDRVGDIDIYWIDTGIFVQLKEKILGRECAAEKIELIYQKMGIESALNTFKEIYQNQRSQFHFFPSELLMICGRMIAAGKTEDAEEFYLALLDTLPEQFRLRQGYAVVCILNGRTEKGAELINKLWTQFPQAKSLTAMEPLASNLNFCKKYADELILLKFMAREFPDSYLAFYDLAAAHENLGDHEAAVEACRKSLELNPDFELSRELLNRLKKKPEETDLAIYTGSTQRLSKN